MEQVAKLKRAWDLAPVFQIVEKISEKYCPCLYLSIDQVWFVNVHPVSYNTHHDITDLVNHGGGLKIQKLEYLENEM